MSDATPREIVLTQDFFPRFGGAHSWLYETFKRWPGPVRLLTQDYSASPADRAAQTEFDAAIHGSLDIIRRDIAITDLNLVRVSSWRRILHVCREIQRLRKGEQATLYCLRAFPEGFCGAMIRLLHKRTTRLVVFAHGEEILVARSSRQLLVMAKLAYGQASLVIANSKNTVALVKTLCPEARVVCVHPGVNVAEFLVSPTQSSAMRSSWGWPAGTVIVTTIARMEPRKNQGAVLRSVAALRSEGLPVAYVCAGDGEERGRLEQLAAELGISQWVRFPGALSNTDKVLTYAASDLYAMPSVQVGEMIEGFGIVFLEAAAAGIPAICGNVGGQSEAVIDGETGLVVDGAQEGEVTAAMRRLAVDPALRARMGSAARRRVVNFDWAPLGKQMAAAISGTKP
jgi:phosphatidylinositol alpha-1,6-mannosyltransferase